MSASATPPAAARITAIVLAGGRGSRMGGVDKGLVPLQGRTMVEHVLERLRPQVGAMLINANRNLDRYAAFGCPVVPDRADGFLGPLAGMASGMAAAGTPYVVTAPCDSPFIGPDLVARLATALARDAADIAVAHDGERTHPVFLLLRRDLLDDLDAFISSGGRKIDLWFARHRVALADFSDCPQAFLNINDENEHRSIEGQLKEAG
jgi:molybdenum cofactor guanylyltransferase